MLMAPIGGSTVIDRTIDAVEAVPEISAIVLARRRTTPGVVSAAIRRRPVRKERVFGAAGATRLEALALALEVAPASVRLLVHDANRPLVSTAALSTMLRESEGDAAAVAAVPGKSTYKEVVKGRIRRTLPRDQLFVVQGPWFFRRSTLEGALAGPQRQRWLELDELDLCREAGIPVRLVRSDYLNVAVATSTDLEFGELALARSYDIPSSIPGGNGRGSGEAAEA